MDIFKNSEHYIKAYQALRLVLIKGGVSRDERSIVGVIADMLVAMRTEYEQKRRFKSYGN